MSQAASQSISPVRLPKLAATALFFLGLSTNTHLDSVALNAVHSASLQPHVITPQAKVVTPQAKVIAPAPVTALSGNTEITAILSPHDAEFYRAAFAAQEQSDWASADNALSQVKDKRLVGHVLADRYSHRVMTLDEAKQWLAAYAELPEADNIYAQAQQLHGFATAHIGRPPQTGLWSSSGSFDETPLGFRASSLGPDSLKGHAGANIIAALHRGEPMIARTLLATEIQRGTLTTAEANEITGQVAAAFYYDGQIERARPMAHSAAASGIPLGLWIDGMAAWKQQDYVTATRSFASLAQTPKLSSADHAAAAYWAYRGAKHLNDETQARHWLAEAMKFPQSFYGYLAASLSGHHSEAMGKLPEFNAKNTSTLAQHAPGWQALALVQVGRNDLAEKELRQLMLTGRHDVQTATLALAEKARMPALTMQLGGVVTNDNGQPYQAAMYPLPPWQPADGFKVDRALLYALMKRESQFDPDAVSASGACGLMQIMPATARLISNDNPSRGHNAHECPDRLFEPAANMAMGQKYVRVLAGQPMIGNNLMLLLAAYNGGPGNVSRWLDGEDRRDPLLFMESLPLHETRDYVQQVLLHYWKYRSRLAEPEDSVAQLARGEWPRYALNDNQSKDEIAKNLGITHTTTNSSLELASIDPFRMRASK